MTSKRCVAVSHPTPHANQLFPAAMLETSRQDLMTKLSSHETLVSTDQGKAPAHGVAWQDMQRGWAWHCWMQVETTS